MLVMRGRHDESFDKGGQCRVLRWRAVRASGERNWKTISQGTPSDWQALLQSVGVLRFGKASRSCNAIQCDVVVGAHIALIVIDDFLIRNVELKSCSQGRLYLRLFLSLCSSPTVKETEHMRKCSWNFWIA